MKPREWAGLTDLDQKCFPYDSSDDLRPDRLWWVAVTSASGKVVGYAGAYLWRPDFALVLCRAGVAWRHRGHGLQRRLIAARVQQAKREGMREVWTYTSHANIASNNSLIATGFTLWHPEHWGGTKRVMRTTPEHGWLYWRKVVG